MLHTKFQASEPSGSEEEDFWIFEYISMNFYGSNPGPTGLGPSWTLHFNKLRKGLLGNATYQISSLWTKEVLKKKIFEDFPMYFYGSMTILDPATFV